MYNKVRKDIPQLSSHIYILSLSASLLQTLMICLYYCLPSAERVNERGSNLENGKAVQGIDRRYSGGTPEVTEKHSPPHSPPLGESEGGGVRAFVPYDPVVMISCLRLFSMQYWIQQIFPTWSVFSRKSYVATTTSRPKTSLPDFWGHHIFLSRHQPPPPPLGNKKQRRFKKK